VVIPDKNKNHLTASSADLIQIETLRGHYLPGVDIIDELPECFPLELWEPNRGRGARGCRSHRAPWNSANLSSLCCAETLASETEIIPFVQQV
jgi:hypothetical protein